MKVKIKSLWIRKRTLSTPTVLSLYFTVNCTLFQCSSIIKQSITKSFSHLSHQDPLFCSAKKYCFPSDPLHLLFSFRRTSHDRVTTYKSSLITPHTLFFTTAITTYSAKPLKHKYIRQLRRVQPCSPYQL